MPTLGSAHIDVALTDLSIRYINDELIADEVMPPLPVAKRTDKYFVYSKDAYLSTSGVDATTGRPRSVRRPGAPAAMIDYALSTDSYTCEELALRALVTDALVAVADNPLQPEIDATEFTTERVKLDNEQQVALKVGTRANYNASYKQQLTGGGSGTSWAQYASASSHPFTDIKNARIAVIQGIQKNANAMLLTVDSARTLADHPDYKDQYKYTTVEGQTLSGLSKSIRGLEVIEGSQQYNTAPEGAAVTTGDLWVDDQGEALAMIYYRSSSTGPKTVHYGRTMDAPDDTTHVRGFQVRRYRMEDVKGTWIETSVLRDYKHIGVDAAGLSVAGYLISGTTL